MRPDLLPRFQKAAAHPATRLPRAGRWPHRVHFCINITNGIAASLTPPRDVLMPSGVRRARKTGRGEWLARADKRDAVLLEHLLHTWNIRTHDRAFGDHHRLMAVTNVVAE